MLDLDAARTIAAKAMPAMRACMAKLPTTVIEVQITRDGPVTPFFRDRPRYSVPPNNVSVKDTLELDVIPRVDVESAIRCVQTIAEKISMPAPKERDTYYIARFLVVGS